jgi:hypothetical protein
MQGRKRCQCGQGLDRRIGDFDRSHKIAAAVDDAMSDGQQRAACKIAIDPIKDIDEQGLAVIVGRAATFLEQFMARCVHHREARFGVVFVEQAFAKQVRLAPRKIEQPEFDAGRARIQDQNGVGHD